MLGIMEQQVVSLVEDIRELDSQEGLAKEVRNARKAACLPSSNSW